MYGTSKAVVVKEVWSQEVERPTFLKVPCLFGGRRPPVRQQSREDEANLPLMLCPMFSDLHSEGRVLRTRKAIWVFLSGILNFQNR